MATGGGAFKKTLDVEDEKEGLSGGSTESLVVGVSNGKRWRPKAMTEEQLT